MTVDEYRQLPDREDVIQELHCGALVTLARPKMKHVKLQFKLVELLRPTAEHLGVVETEVAFRALPEYDLHGTDIAYVSQHRWDSTSDADNLHGSPELVIEVLSPSNTKAEIREKRSSACRAEHRSSGWSTRNGKPSASPAKAASQRLSLIHI